MQKTFAFLTTIALALILAISFLGCEKTSRVNPETQGEIRLTEIGPQGLAQAIERHRGKAVLVDFWATWCPPCKELFPHTVDLHHRFAKDGLAVITVSLDSLDERERVLAFLRLNGADTENYQSNLQSDAETVDAFQIEGGGIPFLRIYDRTGKVFRTISGNQPAKIEQSVVEALGYGKTS
jgi:thiol-disulfide isomerase/thioredoxin